MKYPEEEKLSSVVHELIHKGDYDTALDVIDRFYSSRNRNQDDHIIRDKCDALKALIYERQEKFDEALSLYISLAEGLNTNDSLFIYRNADVSKILYKLCRTEEAISLIEKILSSQTNGTILSKLELLDLYLRILEEQNATISKKYQLLILNLATDIGIDDLTSFNQHESDYLNLVVKELTEKYHASNREYSRFLLEIEEVEDDKQYDDLLKKYISQEKVGYFRNLAIQELG
jgi:tetratricopeptide (TPR) repeat protein